MRIDIDSLIKEADVYAAYGRFSEAISMLESAIACEPSSALHIKLAEIRQKSKIPIVKSGRNEDSAHQTRTLEALKKAYPEGEPVDLNALRREAEALPDTADRAQALAGIADLEQAEQELNHLQAEEELLRLRLRRERRWGLLIMLPVVIAAAIFFISKLVAGKMPNIFLLDTPYLSWDSDPYVFIFVVAFISILLFALGCAAFGITRFGYRASRGSILKKSIQPILTDKTSERQH